MRTPTVGELIHVDVKKLGRIPDGGGWRVHGRSEDVRGRGPIYDYDYDYAAVDDRTRPAHAEIHPDERAVTCAEFLARAAEHGITRIKQVTLDNTLAYRLSTEIRAAVAALSRTRLVKSHCPWQNGKIERFNRAL